LNEFRRGINYEHFCNSFYKEVVLVTVATHTPHRSKYAAITLITSMYPHLTKCVILPKYWRWLPDDGFLVNRIMLEQLPYFKMF